MCPQRSSALVRPCWRAPCSPPRAWHGAGGTADALLPLALDVATAHARRCLVEELLMRRVVNIVNVS
jgi:hypothetical protein